MNTMFYKKRTNKFTHILFNLLILSLFISSAFATERTRAEWIAEYDALYPQLKYYTYLNSDTLAWYESHVLRSYLNMYEATQDTKYLDQFVTHVDVMISHMDDANGDGYNGWDTDAYSISILNGNAEDAKAFLFDEDFETHDASDGTLPEGWIRWGSTSETAYRDNTISSTTGTCLTIKTNPNVGWQVLKKPINYLPGRQYMVEFLGKTTGSNDNGYVMIYDYTTNTNIANTYFNSAEWEKHMFMFTAPAEAGHNLELRLCQTIYTVYDFYAHFDNVIVYLLNYSLLPDNYWNRWETPTTTADTAYVDYDDANPPEGYAVFTVKTDPNVGWQILSGHFYNSAVLDNNNYEPGIKYTVEFSAKTSDPSVKWRLEVYDFTTSKVLEIQSGTNTSWEKFETTFTAPSESGHDLGVRLYHVFPGVTGSSHFDNIRVYQYAEMIVNDGMIAIPIAKFIMMAYQGLIPSSYVSTADDYLDILENHLIPKWDYCHENVDGINGTKSVYVSPDDGSFAIPNITLPHNQYLVYATIYAYLSRALGDTNEADYETRSKKLINAFMSRVFIPVEYNNTYYWHYWDEMLATDPAPENVPYAYGVEDTSHGNIDIEAALACHQAGFSVDSADMQRFANTFIYKMWNGSITSPDIDDWTNGGRGTDIFKYRTWGWIRLGEFNPLIYDLIRTMNDQIWDDGDYTAIYRLHVISEIIKGAPVIIERFEDDDSGDSTLPAGWNRYNSSSSDTYLDADNKFEGAKGLTVKTNGTTWPVIEKSINYNANSTYQVKFMGKISGNANVSGRVHIYDYTTATTIATVFFSDTDWEQRIFTFTAPATAGDNLKIRLYTSAYNVTDGIVHFDNVEIREIE